ncbi:MAG TPA: amino acid adenylation domain-containing protein, partial [Longimicrobiaceae bacterium]|nr:amino acid adenylation domain-containing protein [Longimicrobiaceae bacterium]
GTAQALRALARREGATLFAVLLAGFQALLARYSGSEDVPVGTAVAGRTRLETEGLIGFFVNTLVLRGDLSGGPTGRALVEQARERVLEAHVHQDVPFEKLVEELRVERTRAHSPLFQAMFTFDPGAAGEGLRLGDVEAEVLAAHGAREKFDLTLGIGDDGERLTGGLSYRTDLWEAATIERMAGHFTALLEGLARDPERRVSELPLLGAAERGLLLEEWNQAEGAYLAERTLHGLFAEQAARTPEAVAVAYEGERLSYGELERRSNRLAHRLRRLGVGPEARVALCIERSPEMLVGVLGILKAGGAYVPLDPAYPAERLAYVLEDCGAAVLVTQEALLAALPRHRAETVCLDRDCAEIERESTEAPGDGAAPGSLAYVIYTSGSTGRPKGVMVTHANVVRLFRATDAWFGFGAEDVWTLFHSYAFDFSVWEIWGALLHGGRLVVVPYLTSRSPEAFLRLLRQEGVTVLNQTPSAFRQLIQAEGNVGAPSDLALRVVVFGGEALELESLRPWMDRHGDERPRLVNMYGITETTVHVTYRPITRGDLEAGRGSVIGRAIPDLRIYLLDAHGQPVPVGVAGEICVGGAGVARGYLDREELTRERFVADPFRAGERIYRSGDLARYRADGELEYLGRADQQLKVRGFRIEPGEIEAALLAQAGVREAVVVARGEGAERRLVAYVTGEGKVDGRGLREGVRERLPEYMVPAAVVVLESIPLTPNGKTDRRALPDPQWSAPGDAYVAPRTEVEEILCGIWSTVLGAGRVGVTDDFFGLGGHSLLATQVAARAEAALGVEVPLRALFEAPTVAGLAERVEVGIRVGGGVQAEPVVRVPRDGTPLPLSFAQQRLWFLDRLEPGSAAYNVAFPLRLRGALHLPALAAALTEIVRRHEALRTVFADVGGEPAQVVLPAAPFPLPVVDLQALPGTVREAEARRLAAEDAAHPFDLARGPLLRAAL